MNVDMQLIVTVARRQMTSASRMNAESVLTSLNRYGDQFGLLLPHRLAQFLAQVMHESGEFHYDREVWGPTPAQQRYEDRADLGHSAAVAGEAFMFRGRTGIQITGRHNTRNFRDWCRSFIGGNVPDFERDPDAMLTDPWEGLGPIWYWEVGNPERKSLNRYADAGDNEMITRRINGGLNGYADRLALYDRISLVLLGYGPTKIEAFQTYAKAQGLYAGEVDGLSGPKTRSAMHKALAAMGRVSVPSAPVTDKEAVTPPELDKPVTQTSGFWERITQLVGLGGIGGVAAIFQDWRVVVAIAGVLIVVAIVGLILHKRIIDAVRNIKAEIGRT